MASRRLAVILAIVLALQASTIASAASATSDAGVPVVATIYAPGQQPVNDSTTIGALEAGCPTSTVAPNLDGAGGTADPGTQPSAQEWALATVLSSTSPGCLPTPIPISAIAQVTVHESNGEADLNPAAQLTQPDLTLPSDFADTADGPVFWDAGSAVIYERPSRGAGDDNAADLITIEPGESLQFDVFEGAAPVPVSITASTTSAAAGQAVTFTASAPGAPAEESYSWNFDGAAATASGSSVSATFTASGVYEVSVQATGAVDGFGQVAIDVGSTPDGSGTTTTPTGPVKSVGPTSGAGVHRMRRKPIETEQSTKQAPSLSAPSTSTAGAAPSRPRSGAHHAGSKGDAGVESGSTSARRAVGRPPASRPAATRRPPGTVMVSGRLLDAAAASDGAGGRASSGQGSGPQVNRPGGGWPWAALGGGLAVVGLLGLGAGLELRSIRFAP